MRAISDILSSLFLVLPAPVVYGLAVVIGLLLLRPWLKNVRAKQIRGRVRRMVRADDAQRDKLAAEAFRTARGNADHLYLLAFEARKRSFPALYQQALDALQAMPEGRRLASQLNEQVAPEKSPTRHPAEWIAIIETMIDNGVYEGARLRLAEALDQHPSHPALLALPKRIDDAQAAAALDGAPDGQ